MRIVHCLFAAGTLLLGTACMRGERPQSHAAWEREATRVWEKETKARVIAAAEAVLKHSDPGDIVFEYRAGGFLARRRFSIFAVLATAEGEDRWNFAAAGNEEGASASVRIIQRGTARSGNMSQSFRDNQTFVGTFRLFWARVDYMLGRRGDWIGCEAAPAALGLPAAEPGTDGLCGITHQPRSAAPPAPLPKAGLAGPAEARRGPPSPPVLADAE